MRYQLIHRGALLLALAAVGCSDLTSTGPDGASISAPTAAAPNRGRLAPAVTGVLSDGGSFVGSVDITSLDFVNGVLMAAGTITGTATNAAGVVTQITGQPFEAAAALLTPDTNGRRCDILFLDLGPINLDLLGLVVDLSRVTLDVYAVPGAGNLLGNLLCGVAGLLDGLGLQALLDQITDLLEDLLGGLSGAATGTLAGGGTFAGTMQLTGLAFEDGQIVATGVLNGVATTLGGLPIPIVNQVFEVVTTLDTNETAGCSILDLDLAPINLDLLGLVVDLSAVELDLTAVPGGGLLGSLLCAVAGLLDPGAGLFALLDRINDILN